MHLSYSSYKNDIISFNSEEYIKNLEDSVSYNIFFNFIESYKEIENEDFKKPIFSQTSKFKKIPNNYKNYKYLKLNRENEDTKNIWMFESPTDESDKIAILIKTYLNKISQDTYKKISVDFINDLVLIDNKNLFKILSTEILNKCLFDNKYRNLYINLCYKIWTNKQIQSNLISILYKESGYYWKFKEDDDEDDNNMNGPFSTEINAKNDAFNKINFKKYFLNHMQKLYVTKDLSFENLDEEATFIKKKKILLLVELIGIMYIEKYINFDIINIIIIDLLHLNNNFKDIEEIEYEALYVLIKLIKDNKTSFNDLNEYNCIFNEFINISNQYTVNNDISKRCIFFLNDIVLMLDSFINNDKNNDKNNCNPNNGKPNNDKPNNDKNYKTIFFDMLKNTTNIEELIKIYKNVNNDDKTFVVYKCIELFTEQKIKNKTILQFLIEIKDIELIYTNLEKLTSNIRDIMLDIPDANEKIIYIINNVPNNHGRKDGLINILSNIESDEDSDQDSDEDSE